MLGWADGYPAATIDHAKDFLAASGELIALRGPAGNHRQQVTVIDAKRRVMGVYHIDNQTGRIELVSVRDISWDLKMEQFNGTDPLPGEIRAMVDRP